MYCSQCGVQLPDNARFCMSCGQSQVVTANDTGNLEMCVIGWEWAGGHYILRPKIRFIATATGPAGSYLAAASKVVRKYKYDFDAEPSYFRPLVEEV